MGITNSPTPAAEVHHVAGPILSRTNQHRGPGVLVLGCHVVRLKFFFCFGNGSLRDFLRFGCAPLELEAPVRLPLWAFMQ